MITTLQKHNTENRNKYSQKRNCAATVPIPTIGLPILLQENWWTNRKNIVITHRHMNVETEIEAAQLLFWEYINRNFFAV
jgi:hypothetical protein